MTTTTSVFPTICADDVAATRDVYVDLFGFDVVFDSGWYVQLQAGADGRTQIGIVERTHASVPVAFQVRPAGVLVSIEVDDVDDVHARVVAAGMEIALPLRDEDFGQRHFMTVDPAGTLVDVITPIAPSPEYAAAYAEGILR